MLPVVVRLGAWEKGVVFHRLHLAFDLFPRQGGHWRGSSFDPVSTKGPKSSLIPAIRPLLPAPNLSRVATKRQGVQS
jgi:hypothetical protein